MIRNSLTRRMLVWFVLIGLLPLVSLGFLTLRYYEKNLRDTTLQHIAELADKKALQIKGLWVERIAVSRIIARSEVTQKAVERLSHSFRSVRADRPEYRAIAAQYSDYFGRYIEEQTMFYDVLLINLQGEVIYSQKAETQLATNLLKKPFSDNGLAEAFRESRLTFEGSSSSYAYYQPAKAMAAFVVVPVVAKGRLLGSIAFQLDIKQIQKLAADPIGMGVSGETVLAKGETSGQVLIVTPLKYEFESTLLPIAASKIPNPMQRALSGIRGGGIETDYRNQQVIAAWRYLPDLRFGMVVKIDAVEAFASLHQQRVFFLSALLLAILFAATVAYYFGRRLVIPLHELAKGAEDVAQGNLSRRVNEHDGDEIGLLGHAFNRMAKNLQSLYGTLEQRVEERTQELNSANALLQDEIVERERINTAARQEHDFRTEMINSLPGIFYMVDATGKFLLWNKNLEQALDCTGEEITRTRVLEFIDEGDRQTFEQDVSKVFELGENSMEADLIARNGSRTPYFFTGRRIERHGEQVMVGLGIDIAARKLAEEEIYQLAYYDTLTNLPNRRLLQDRFGQALAASERNASHGAVIFLDLDKFKTLNDTLGHSFGDLLLVEVSWRIKGCVRAIDTVARMGGDEFVILIEALGGDVGAATQRAALIAEKIRKALTHPYFLDGQEQYSSPSIGVCLYLGRAETVESLLKHADMAMYQAKESGRNKVCFFDPAMQQAVEGRVTMEADLRHAVVLQQLHLYYQIQLDNEHRPLGAEALLRWVHPGRGMVSPAQFIPIAEESILIVEMGSWVLETALKQLKRWEGHELTRDLSLAINVSAQQFALPDFVAQVAAALDKHQVNPARLKLELTESVVLGDVQGTIATMHALKGLGVKLSMDDFGTGYSSLSYLKLLPLDQLKIDQSFVRDITTDPNDAVLVQTIIGMAQNFRLNVIAEGVETEAQLAFLKLHGCMAYQGYLFSKPVPIEEFESLLEKLK